MPMVKGDNTSTMGGVADISPTEAWAVGNTNSNGQTSPTQLIEHWDGTAWSLFSGPSFPSGDEPGLTAMTAISANDIWAVGSLLNPDPAFFTFCSSTGMVHPGLLWHSE